MMVAVALLAMALAAAAGGRGALVLVAAGACAVVAIFGLLVFEYTVRRDRAERHVTPHLLDNTYADERLWKAVMRARGGSEPGGR
ncbi:hypothetical protein NONO_c34300 [Nocardia nova SH22a]|uniref:Transmembrane protein n=1 Tax=Nocardia nova SH22a TaxID=1415166 RepID=W5TG80_9NOCA|nr:hypothetical protein [Nocardia nova]AHH18217.1 hypothetical protein NONO_c34300 [Nocardia nova SH22a]